MKALVKRLGAFGVAMLLLNEIRGVVFVATLLGWVK
jgi:hypothetical protein